MRCESFNEGLAAIIPATAHGDLRAALVTAAEAIIREDGVEGFSLRKAATRAGVTPGAYAYHFSGVKAFLTVVAVRAFGGLKAMLDAITPSGDAARDLRAQAKGYVTYAADNPSLVRLSSRIDLIDCRDAALAAAAHAALFK